MESLRLALPNLDSTRHRVLARQAATHAAASAAEITSLSRFDAVKLCRRLNLTAWSRLDEAQRDGRGALILSSRLGLWQLAAVAVGAYRSPLSTIGRAFDEPPLRRWVDRLERRHGQRVLSVAPTPVDVARTLDDGGLIACSLDRASDEAIVTVTFLGRPLHLSPLPFRAALNAGAAVVPIFGWPEPRGTYRVEIDEPLTPDAAESVEHLIRRSLERVEQAVDRRPELWPWHLSW